MQIFLLQLTAPRQVWSAKLENECQWGFCRLDRTVSVALVLGQQLWTAEVIGLDKEQSSQAPGSHRGLPQPTTSSLCKQPYFPQGHYTPWPMFFFPAGSLVNCSAVLFLKCRSSQHVMGMVKDLLQMDLWVFGFWGLWSWASLRS